MDRVRHCLAAIVLLLAMPSVAAAAAAAADACTKPASTTSTTVLAARVAAIACRENILWYSPFIDAGGRLASMTVAEAETTYLHDQRTPTWARVAEYWRGSGLLWGMRDAPGAAACGLAGDAGGSIPACRAFLVDKPWSAAFVSYVMVQAGVPGFRASPSHIDYVRDAWQHPDSSPYLFADPDEGKPLAGDLLCFVRGAAAVSGHAGLQAFLAADPGAGLAMHCDIAVGTSARGERLYLVGGNVLQGVTLRTLNLNREGRLWALPRGGDPGCGPDNPDACTFNRQNWVVLLKLKNLRPLPPPMPTAPAVPAQCCVACVLGSGIPRCPASRTP